MIMYSYTSSIYPNDQSIANIDLNDQVIKCVNKIIGYFDKSVTKIRGFKAIKKPEFQTLVLQFLFYTAGQQDDPQLRGLHRHGAFDWGRRQEPGGHEPNQHHLW